MRVSFRSLAKERNRSNGKFGKGTTLGKVVRDADTMRQHARYVIELDARGDVIDHYLNDSHAHHVDCIVVLAPAKFLGERVDQAVALEIGLSRFVPYKMTEFKSTAARNKKRVTVIPTRIRVGTLPWGVVYRMLPVLWHAIQTCVDKRMEGWTRARFIQEFDKNRRGRLAVYEAWATIRIPSDQPLLYTILRLKDEQDRCATDKNYAVVARMVSREIADFRRRNFHYRGEYPDEVIKESSALHMIADKIRGNIRYNGYTNRSLDAIKKLVGERSPKNLRILDELLRIFKVPKAPNDAHLDEFEPQITNKHRILKECTIRPCFVVKRERKRKEVTDENGYKHARDCFTISVFGSKEHMLKLEERNVANRLRGTTTEEVKPIRVLPKSSTIQVRDDENDDDIPWDPLPDSKRTGTYDDDIPF